MNIRWEGWKGQSKTVTVIIGKEAYLQLRALLGLFLLLSPLLI